MIRRVTLSVTLTVVALTVATPLVALSNTAPAAAAAGQAGLSPGQELADGQELQDGPFTLAMQTDGNLVEYVSQPDGQVFALWASNTAGRPGAALFMQTDGNLVMYLGGTPIWSSGTWGHPGAAFVLWTTGAMFIANASGLLWGVGQGPASGVFPQPLPGGQTALTKGFGLFNGQSISAGRYLLAMQTDGNLVVYEGSALWASNTAGHPGDYLFMQSDGNLVLYDVHGNAIWASGTHGHPGAFALMQTDGNFVVYSSADRPLWATGSDDPPGTYPPGSSGYDVSIFQCGNLPPPAQIGIVQADGASSAAENPCMAQEAAWAGGGLNLYSFLTYRTSATPEPGCGGNQACNAGFQAAVHAFNDALSSGVDTNVSWWLDVESAGNWSSSAFDNSSLVQGAFAGLQSRGAPRIGIYASPGVWNSIVGAYQPLVPYWMADYTGSGPVSCSQYPFWSTHAQLPTGPLEVVQYASDTYDHDYAC